MLFLTNSTPLQKIYKLTNLIYFVLKIKSILYFLIASVFMTVHMIFKCISVNGSWWNFNLHCRVHNCTMYTVKSNFRLSWSWFWVPLLSFPKVIDIMHWSVGVFFLSFTFIFYFFVTPVPTPMFHISRDFLTEHKLFYLSLVTWGPQKTY